MTKKHLIPAAAILSLLLSSSSALAFRPPPQDVSDLYRKPVAIDQQAAVTNQNLPPWGIPIILALAFLIAGAVWLAARPKSGVQPTEVRRRLLKVVRILALVLLSLSGLAAYGLIRLGIPMELRTNCDSEQKIVHHLGKKLNEPTAEYVIGQVRVVIPLARLEEYMRAQEGRVFSSDLIQDLRESASSTGVVNVGKRCGRECALLFRQPILDSNAEMYDVRTGKQIMEVTQVNSVTGCGNLGKTWSSYILLPDGATLFYQIDRMS